MDILQRYKKYRFFAYLCIVSAICHEIYFSWSQVDIAMVLKAQNTDSLLTLIAEGSQRAFDVFYHAYYEQVFRTALYYLRNTDTCREVVSDVFFAAWKGRKTLPKINDIDSYLYVITRNEALRWLQREEKRNSLRVSLSSAPVQLEIEDEIDTASGIETAELEKALTEAVDLLPEKCRIIFLMSREHGLSSVDIAHRLSISDSTVRVQLKIAVTKIVTHIQERFPNILVPLLAMMFPY